MTGSSAGGLICILAACGVDAHAALEAAAALCESRGVFARPWGLAGVWGGLVREWLGALLPADAAERVMARRVGVAVTRLPWLTTETVWEFKSKEDLIDVALASAHIPWFMDGRAFAVCRNAHACIDGSILYLLFGRTAGIVPAGLSPDVNTGPPTKSAAAAAATTATHPPPAAGAKVKPDAVAAAATSENPRPHVLLFDPRNDEVLRREWRWSACLELLSVAGARRLLAAGHAFAKRLDEAGHLGPLRAAGAAAAAAAAIASTHGAAAAAAAAAAAVNPSAAAAAVASTDPTASAAEAAAAGGRVAAAAEAPAPAAAAG